MYLYLLNRAILIGWTCLFIIHLHVCLCLAIIGGSFLAWLLVQAREAAESDGPNASIARPRVCITFWLGFRDITR
jgi:threonine/homoserine/homoserine lactone efflux protein